MAQWIEHRTSNPAVVGSSPTGRTIFILIPECACTPIGLESGDSKSLGGNHSACRFESDLAHSGISGYKKLLLTPVVLMCYNINTEERKSCPREKTKSTRLRLLNFLILINHNLTVMFADMALTEIRPSIVVGRNISEIG